MKHILETKQKEQIPFKCAIIVNDMAELNVDKNLIDQSAIRVGSVNKVIAMQNGCVCCTLSDDLSKQIIELAQEDEYDYMIIEASGISEPSQIARLFQHADDHDHASHADQVLLQDVASVDTCATVISAAEFFENFEDVTRQGDTKQDPWSKLMVEQIEYANVLILNKTDLCNDEQLDKIEEHLNILNPNANIIRSYNSQIDVSKVVATKLFNVKQFEMFSHTNVDLNAMPKCCSKSIGRGESPCCRRARTIETEKSQVLLNSKKLPQTRHESRFAIHSFLYKARRPFHPKRFTENFIDRFFMYGALGVDPNEDADADAASIAESNDEDKKGREEDFDDAAFNELKNIRSQYGFISPEYQQAANDAGDDIFDAVEAESKKETKDKAKAERLEKIQKHQHFAKMKQKHRNDTIGGVLRSKGYIWTTHCHDYKVIYQQSCNTVTIEVGDAHWDVLNKKAWIADSKKGHGHGHGVKSEQDMFRENFVEPFGDRRQEIVFIGNGMKHDVIQKLLDECLLTDLELKMGVDGWKAMWGNL
jgi:G3E family GTPase